MSQRIPQVSALFFLPFAVAAQTELPVRVEPFLQQVAEYAAPGETAAPRPAPGLLPASAADAPGEIRDVATDAAIRIAAASSEGLYVRSGSETAWQRLLPRDGDRSWAPVDVRAVEFDYDGGLWFASPQGLGVQDADIGVWRLYDPMDGLPWNDFTSLAAAPQERDGLWKAIDPRWPKSADGKWYWKSDTSSDELDGHFFFYGLYYDLVARDDAERAEVRETVLAIVDHLVENDGSLIDHDGERTRWAVFGPEQINDDQEWWEERGLNSLSYLTYLRIAEHMAGDADSKQHYARTARTLIEDHAYASNLRNPKVQSGPGTGNQSDDETYSRGDFPLDDAALSLVLYPLDRFDWGLSNSHRLDVVLLRGQEEQRGSRGHLLDGRVLPIDERFVNHWNHDPWRLDHGGQGRYLADGASFLLPYYLGLYHGLIEETVGQAGAEAVE